MNYVQKSFLSVFALVSVANINAMDTSYAKDLKSRKLPLNSAGAALMRNQFNKLGRFSSEDIQGVLAPEPQVDPQVEPQDLEQSFFDLVNDNKGAAVGLAAVGAGAAAAYYGRGRLASWWNSIANKSSDAYNWMRGNPKKSTAAAVGLAGAAAVASYCAKDNESVNSVIQSGKSKLKEAGDGIANQWNQASTGTKAAVVAGAAIATVAGYKAIKAAATPKVSWQDMLKKLISSVEGNEDHNIWNYDGSCSFFEHARSNPNNLNNIYDEETGITVKSLFTQKEQAQIDEIIKLYNLEKRAK